MKTIANVSKLVFIAVLVFALSSCATAPKQQEGRAGEKMTVNEGVFCQTLEQIKAVALFELDGLGIPPTTGCAFLPGKAQVIAFFVEAFETEKYFVSIYEFHFGDTILYAATDLEPKT